MTTEQEKPEIADESGDKYKYGFVTDIASDTAPKGLSEDIIRLISQKKGEPDWLLERRLEAFRFWQKLKEPTWAKLTYDKIDYQDLYYYSAPKQKVAPKSLDEVDPELLKTYEKFQLLQSRKTDYGKRYYRPIERRNPCREKSNDYLRGW